jgi:hypothetical protein
VPYLFLNHNKEAVKVLFNRGDDSPEDGRLTASSFEELIKLRRFKAPSLAQQQNFFVSSWSIGSRVQEKCSPAKIDKISHVMSALVLKIYFYVSYDMF